MLFALLGLLFLISPLASWSWGVSLALCWKGMLSFERARDRFWFATLWFALIQLVQISWMASPKYMGGLIFLVYALLAFAIGVQFGLLSLLLSKNRTPLSLLGIAGAWVLLEWSRIYLCTGFPWNPIGLALAKSGPAIQMASLFGVYGLSFWVIWVNLSALSALQEGKRWKIIFALSLLFPYLFGFMQSSLVAPSAGAKTSIALVQTALLPEKKDPAFGGREELMHPLDQWERIFALFAQKKGAIDLIVFPEGAVPYDAYKPFYYLENVRASWLAHFGDFRALPEPKGPLGIQLSSGKWMVTNAYIAQALSNRFQSHLIIGLGDSDGEEGYNAAFHFAPHKREQARYEKRILVPVGEYVPLTGVQWISDFVRDRFGIECSFHAGEEAKVFLAQMPLGISICAEETYSHLIREMRQKGAEAFVNITNDAWFPGTNLPEIHFLHGRIRAAENGVYLFRACNTGVTGVVDCFGREVARLALSEETAEVLFATIGTKQFSTLYSFWGDVPILVMSGLFLVVFWRRRVPGK